MRKLLSYALALVLIGGMYIGVTRAAGPHGIYDYAVAAGSVTLATTDVPVSYPLISSYPRISNLELMSVSSTGMNVWNKELSLSPQTFINTNGIVSMSVYLRNNAAAVAPDCSNGCGAGDVSYRVYPFAGITGNAVASKVHVSVVAVYSTNSGNSYSTEVYNGLLADYNPNLGSAFTVPYSVDRDMRLDITMTQVASVARGDQQLVDYGFSFSPLF